VIGPVFSRAQKLAWSALVRGTFPQCSIVRRCRPSSSAARSAASPPAKRSPRLALQSGSFDAFLAAMSRSEMPPHGPRRRPSFVPPAPSFSILFRRFRVFSLPQPSFFRRGDGRPVIEAAEGARRDRPASSVSRGSMIRRRPGPPFTDTPDTTLDRALAVSELGAEDSRRLERLRTLPGWSR
jgi:hypothetical protein